MTETPTPPAMTPEQRAHFCRLLNNAGLGECANQLEADGVELARLTGMLDDYYPAVDWWILQAKEAHEAQLKAEAALTAERDAAQAEISRLAKINVKLCADFNLMNQHGAKQDTEIARLTADLATAREDGMREAIAIASARSHERKSFHSPFSVPISEAVNAIEAAIQKGAAT